MIIADGDDRGTHCYRELTSPLKRGVWCISCLSELYPVVAGKQA